MTRSNDDWVEISKTRNDYQLAQFVISDLIGYRSTSLHRAEDTDNLMRLIGVLRSEDE